MQFFSWNFTLDAVIIFKKVFQFEYFFFLERSINEIECERSEVENYCDKNQSVLSSCSHNLHFSDIISTTMFEQIKSELDEKI